MAINSRVGWNDYPLETKRDYRVGVAQIASGDPLARYMIVIVR